MSVVDETWGGAVDAPGCAGGDEHAATDRATTTTTPASQPRHRAKQQAENRRRGVVVRTLVLGKKLFRPPYSLFLKLAETE